MNRAEKKGFPQQGAQAHDAPYWRRVELLICLTSFLTTFVPVYAIDVISFEQRGLSARDIGFLYALSSGIGLFLQVPSGALGDRIGRVHLITISYFAKAFGILLWGLFPNFWGFLAGMVLWSMRAFETGTYEALIHEVASGQGHPERFESLWGKINALSFAGLASGVVIGGFMSFVGFEMLCGISFIFVAAGAVLWASMPALPQARVHDGARRIFLNAIREIRRNPPLMLLLAFGFLIEPAGATALDFCQLLFEAAHVPLMLFGVAIAALSVAAMLATMVVARFCPRHTPWRFEPFAIAAGLSLATLLLPLPGVVKVLALAMFYALMVLCSALVMGQTQRAISAGVRGTVSSISVFIYSIGSLLYSAGFGNLSSLSSVEQTYGGIGVFVALSATVYFLLRSTLLQRWHREKVMRSVASRQLPVPVKALVVSPLSILPGAGAAQGVIDIREARRKSAAGH